MFDFTAIKDIATTIQTAVETLDLRLKQILDVLTEIRDSRVDSEPVVPVPNKEPCVDCEDD